MNVAVISLKDGFMALSIRTLLATTFAIGVWIALAPKFLAVLVFVLCCSPCVITICRLRQIRKRFGNFITVAISMLSFIPFYLALTGPWFMYTTYHGCATPFYGIETPVCDFLNPFMMDVVAPTMSPATEISRNLTFNADYDPALGTSISNFDPASWYTCEWMRYGMWLLTDEPPF